MMNEFSFLDYCFKTQEVTRLGSSGNKYILPKYELFDNIYYNKSSDDFAPDRFTFFISPDLHLPH